MSLSLRAQLNSSRFFIHPFREGNTRTQFVFFSQLAEQAGYAIHAAAFAGGGPVRDEFIAARYWSHTHDASRLAAVLRKAIGHA